jgi:hypothetical protein
MKTARRESKPSFKEPQMDDFEMSKPHEESDLYSAPRLELHGNKNRRSPVYTSEAAQTEP